MSGFEKPSPLSPIRSRQSDADVAADAAVLTWWRTRLPSSFTCADRDELVASLARCDEPTCSQWSAAVNGDPAVSIGLAFAILPSVAYQPKAFDGAMSAILRCALLGEHASIVMLVHVLGRLGRRNTDLRLVLLAGAWRRAAAAFGNDRSPSNIILWS